MPGTVTITVEMLQTKLHLEQAVVVSVVGSIPAVFVVLKRDAGAQPAGEFRVDALTAVSAERAREMAMALWNAAKSVDLLNTEKGEG